MASEREDIKLRHVRLGEGVEVWHIWVVGQATQRGWRPTVHPPLFARASAKLVEDLNDAIDFLVEYSASADNDQDPYFVLDGYFR